LLLAELRGRKRYLDRIVVRAGGRVLFPRVEELDWLEAAGNHVSSGALPTIPAQLAFALQFSNGSRVAAQTVPGKHVRWRLSALADAFFRKILAASRSRVSES
jgi:hypothetical protein